MKNHVRLATAIIKSNGIVNFFYNYFSAGTVGIKRLCVISALTIKPLDGKWMIEFTVSCVGFIALTFGLDKSFTE